MFWLSVLYKHQNASLLAFNIIEVPLNIIEFLLGYVDIISIILKASLNNIDILKASLNNIK